MNKPTHPSDKELLEWNKLYAKRKVEQKSMTDEQMLTAVREACGWSWSLEGHWISRHHQGKYHDAPNYLEDLNAMHEAEKVLPNNNSMHGLVVYCSHLLRICGSHQACHFATARQRAEAFCRTLFPEKFKC